ncbi:sensor histidine kinase [Microbaculum marinisediminis]|uniref:histidine kinase n=1 Tax=Microbaculum marinisediminis TaxID=2931392 RepID=A0AAW5QZZ3_9HYPH|nr:PAS domain-containing sensor histidine kinase [Microbaculum sp. A6E488]MCT8971983.1 ATP-binding protein [Microbaculum sp. A6E488]
MRPKRRQMGDGGVAPTLALCLAWLSPMPALAQSGASARTEIAEAVTSLRGRVVDSAASIPQETLAALSLFLGILFFAVLAAVLFVRTRARLQAVERGAREQIGELSARVERAEGLLAVDQNVLVVWPPADEAPEIKCDPGPSRVLPARRGDVLAFGKWLDADSAFELERLVTGLRARGESFNVMLRTRARGDAEPGHVEADGRSVGGRAVLRMRDLAGQRRELAGIHDRLKRLSRDVEGLHALMNVVPMPAWLRDAGGKLVWANDAYARAVGAGDLKAAIEADTPLLDDAARAQVEETRKAGGIAHRQVPVSVRGGDRVHEVWDVRAERFNAGIAVDVNELDRLRHQLGTRDSIHARTLDQVSTAVAVFGADRRLVFNNRSFRQLWALDEPFLDSRPGFDEILDRLRAAGRIQEPGEYRRWRDDQLAIFGSDRGADGGEPMRQTLWHLPDGRAFRVVLARQGDGAVSALFEDVTASIDLESRFVALTQVQRETIDSLDEGIAVFGTDGRLKLHNPAFATIWSLSGDDLDGEPHVEAVIGWCRDLYDDDTVWASLRAVVTGLLDSRESVSVRMERPDRSIVDLRAVPLPDGATLVVFTDVSDSARIERALRDRNEALMTAARIKNEFVHKVSYELRAPLTNIIGFAQLMSDGEPGALSERQREYSGYILSSSSALLAIINDILDLATIDAGVMELDIGDVDIRAAVEAVTDGLQDRLKESEIALDIDVPEDIGSFEADEKRIRQILFNLLSNAVGFSDPGQSVRITCRRNGGYHIVFAVSDTGPGIPDEVRRTVFERFESHSLGTRHRGAGLGLSIVKSFVELHGGSVDLETRPGQGTVVTCTFPARQPERAMSHDDEEAFEAEVHTFDRAPQTGMTIAGADARTGRSERQERR